MVVLRKPEKIPKICPKFLGVFSCPDKSQSAMMWVYPGYTFMISCHHHACCLIDKLRHNRKQVFVDFMLISPDQSDIEIHDRGDVFLLIMTMSDWRT